MKQYINKTPLLTCIIKYKTKWSILIEYKDELVVEMEQIYFAPQTNDFWLNFNLWTNILRSGWKVRDVGRVEEVNKDSKYEYLCEYFD